jgi:dethiobiotin synthetase
MSARFVIAGTDTGVGKTVCSAMLTQALNAFYWKPVQAGLQEETDSECVARLSGAPPPRIFPEAYRLATAASPHYAARLDGVEITPAALTPPTPDAPLIIETAGGVLTPLTHELLTADLMAQWGLPVVLVGRTALGAINHALVSIEALRARGVPLHGMIFCGEENLETQETIAAIGRIRALGRLPPLSPVTRDALAAAFARGFRRQDFLE